MVRYGFVDWLNGRRFIKGGWRWLVHNTVFQLLFVIGALSGAYYGLLKFRNLSPNGFFGDPSLVVLSDILFWVIGAFLFVLFNVIKHKLSRKRR